MEEPQPAHSKHLWNKDFSLLWAGQAVSMLGNRIFMIALIFWIKEATGSATLMGMILMGSQLPGIILGPFGGAFADQVSRRRILVVTDFVNGILILLFPLMIWMRPNDTDLLLNLLFLISVGSGIANSFFNPAIVAAIPDIVPREQLARANATHLFTGRFANILGQVVGPVLFRLVGGPVLFFFNGLSFLISAVTELFINIPQTLPEEKLSPRAFLSKLVKDTGEGFRYVYQNKGMRGVFLGIAVVNLFMGPTTVLLPFYVENSLHRQMDWYGYIMAAMSAGFLAGSMIAASNWAKKQPWLVFASLPAFALCYCGLGFPGPIAISVLLFFLLGLIVSIFNIHITTAIQLSTDSSKRGRVFGLLSTLSRSLYPISLGLSGLVADLMNQDIPKIFLGSGICVLLISLTLVASRSYRTFMHEARS